MPREEKSFKYKKRTPETVRERANMRSGNYDSFIKTKYKLYKVRDGKNIIRVLPPTWDDAEHYGLDIFVNYGIGVDNQSYLSLSKMKNEKDPLAEARRQAERDGDKDLAKALSPTQRILMWVIDRNDEDEGPQLWAAPFSFDKSLASLSYDEDTKEVIYLDDPEDGCDVRFYREGKGLTTKYDAAKIRVLKPSPLHEDEGVMQEWLDYIKENPLPEVLQYYDYDHISSVFDGSVRSPDDKDSKKGDDDDADEKPTRRRIARDDDEDDKPKKKRTRITADDDNETEDDDKPARRRRAVDDDNESEDDTDEKPIRRRVGKNTDDDTDDEKPVRSKRTVTDDDNETEDDDKPARRRRVVDDDNESEDDTDDDKPKTRGEAIRNRLSSRNKR